jgi:hypothetical protein
MTWKLERRNLQRNPLVNQRISVVWLGWAMAREAESCTGKPMHDVVKRKSLSWAMAGEGYLGTEKQNREGSVWLCSD